MLFGVTLALTASLLRGQPVITEFMADNDSVLMDEEGEYPDWIEIHNPGDTAVNLVGWHLTDKADSPTKWTFPGVTLEAGGYLVVFASGEDRTDPAGTLHTNFSLSAGGEYLGLIEPDGVTVASEFSPEYPAQVEDVSYGVTQPTDGAEDPAIGYFETPTPEAANGGSANLLILDGVTFSDGSRPFAGALVLGLSGASGDQVIRYKTVSPSSAGGAADDPDATSPLYLGPVELTSSSVVKAAVFSADGARHGPVSTEHYVRIDDFSAQRIDTFRSQLPLVVFDNHGFGPMEKDGIERPAWWYIFEPDTDGVAAIDDTPDFVSGLELEVRGQTSSLFPKKSFKFDLVDNYGLKTPGAPLGLGEFDEWAIIGPWNYDRSYIRNAFVYELSNRMGRWAPRTRLVEMFFNEDGGPLDLADYAGIYVVTDKDDAEPGRIDIEELDSDDIDPDDISGGYLLEIDEPDDEKYSWETDHGIPGVFTSVLLVDTPKAKDLAPEQRDYIRSYVQDMENAIFAGRDGGWSNRAYLQYLDRGSWIDYHLLNTFVMNTDSFWRGAKFYKDRGGRMMAGPMWDLDRSIDSADPRDDEWATWELPDYTDQGFGVDFWDIGWWGLLAEDPEFQQGWFDRWQELRGWEFNNEQLTHRIDELADQIGVEAASRDALKWPDNVSEHGSFTAEIAHMKEWLINRAGWIDSILASPPRMDWAVDGSVTLVPPDGGAQVVYTLNGADPRLRGGGIAPDALVSDGPVTIPPDAKFRARTYNSLNTARPGTEWSRAVPGGIGAPFAEAPRVVNLSSRTRVEAGDNVLISGIVVNDADGKWLLLRGVGAGLADLAAGELLADPLLSLFDAEGELIASNHGWSEGGSADEIADLAERVGAFPLVEGSTDAAMLVHLPPGRYSMHLGSVSGGAGTALAEVYETDAIGALLNLSARGLVAGDNDPLIAGFVVTGDQPKRVLVRGIGPALAEHGVTDPLADPRLQIFHDGEVVAANENWSDDDPELVAAASALVGAFELPEASVDAALMVTLDPGIYTAVVSGAGDAGGPALVEVYEVR